MTMWYDRNQIYSVWGQWTIVKEMNEMDYGLKEMNEMDYDLKKVR